MKVAIVQLNSSDNKADNLLQMEQWVIKACESEQLDLIALPEMFTLLGGDLAKKHAAAEKTEKGEAISLLKSLAKRYQIYLHGGSLAEFDSDHYYNTTFVFKPNGQLIARYRKIHLFKLFQGQIQYHEARFLSPGNDIVTYDLDHWKIGCAICFDLRFGDLFQQFIRQHVNVIILPSAFTYETGLAHWEILLRARAIETQSYILAPAQTGMYNDNNQERRCYGHSMIIDPWGNILASLEEDVGFITAILDINHLNRIRARLPCLPVHK